jgi:chorismate mutase/prephenate dehydratase
LIHFAPLKTLVQTMTADELKTELRKLDSELAGCLARRFELLRTHPELIEQACRPEELVDTVKTLPEDIAQLVPEAALKRILCEVQSAAANLNQVQRIAFLGPSATFTHQAAMRQFGPESEYLPQTTISDVFDAVVRDRVTYGVVPVENSTEGSVTHTLDMFADSDIQICAEMNMPIHHCLLSRCEKKDVHVVYTHPQVLGQCRVWLQRNMPEVHQVEVSSTTEAAERANREDNAAALAGRLAAETYDLPVRAENIEDYHGNTTRFLVLCKHTPEPTGDDKTSLLLVIRDRVGALYDALLPFGRHEVNLTFIESRPSKRRNWEYYFFIDICGHVTEQKVQETLDDLREQCQFIKILGSYPRAAN